MKGLLAVIAAGVVGLSGCTPHTEAESQGVIPPTQLLEKAQAATSNTDYEGAMESRVLYRNEWLSSDIRAFFHKPDMWRMEYLSGKMKGVVCAEANEVLWRMEPETHQVIIAQGHRPEPWEQDKLIEKNYSVAVGPRAQLAGRDTTELDLNPKNPGSPNRRFWVDNETRVILGWELLRLDGSPQSITKFKTVTFKSQPDNIFQPPHGKTMEKSPAQLNQPVTLVELQKKVGFPLVLPAWLPSGFRNQGHYLTECEDDCHAPVALSRFTDGQNTLSLFQGRHVIEPEPMNRTGHGSSGGQHVVRIVRNGTNYVLIGNLDSAQLQKIIQSIPRNPHTS